MDDKKENGEEKEHDNIFRNLQDEQNRDLLQGIIEPMVKSVLTSILPEIKENIKGEVKSLVETKLKDFGLAQKGKRTQDHAEDNGCSNMYEVSKKPNDNEKYEPNKFESFRTYNTANEAISYWQKMANEEWESARREDITELKGMITVICLDTSESMSENNALVNAKYFVSTYLDSVAEVHSNKSRKEEMVALVAFGKETKVLKRLTRDYEGLKTELETLKPEGPSPMFGGLVLSRAVAKTSDCITMMDGEYRILPKIILITDGKPTDIKLKTGPERTDSDNLTETLRIIEDEAKTLTHKEIELHLVYVGKPDYVFLHSLKDCTGGNLITYKETDKMAFHVFLDAFIRSRKNASKEEKPEQSEDKVRGVHAELLGIQKKILDNFKRDFEEFEKTHLPVIEALRNRYRVEKDTKVKYPRIGSRVIRAKDWTWGQQDGNGPGTIIGHCPKGNIEDKQVKVWVEWDEYGRQNIYRFQTVRRYTKADVKIVQDRERVPPEDEILAVGMKVGIGRDYSGEVKPRQGVVIKIIDNEDDDDDNDDSSKPSSTGDGVCSSNKFSDALKAEVLWEDDERGLYFFGDEGSKVEIQPRIIYAKPEKPQNVKITDITDKEVCLSWDHPASSGGCNIKKYSVFMKPDKLDSRWYPASEVEGTETKATVPNLEKDVKYKFAVAAENKVGLGNMIETTDFVRLNTSISKPEPPAGPLNIMYVTKSSCMVDWNESPVSEKTPVTHYVIEIREAGKSGWEKVQVERTTSKKITKLRKATTYELQVKSGNDTGVSEPLGTELFKTKTFLDSDIPTTLLTEQNIVTIATALSGDWQLLGHYFGLNNVNVEHVIMHDKTAGVPMLIYKMLSLWRQKNPRTATFYKLVEGMEAVNAVTTVDWDKIAEVARQINEPV